MPTNRRKTRAKRRGTPSIMDFNVRTQLKHGFIYFPHESVMPSMNELALIWRAHREELTAELALSNPGQQPWGARVFDRRGAPRAWKEFVPSPRCVNDYGRLLREKEHYFFGDPLPEDDGGNP